jgi:hypothetical protein
MSQQQQSFDGFPVLAGAQFVVSPAMPDVDGRIQISMRSVATDPTAKRLLIRSVGSVWVVAHTALLRGIGALDPDGGYPSLSGIPGDLPGNVRQVGGVQIGVQSR